VIQLSGAAVEQVRISGRGAAVLVGSVLTLQGLTLWAALRPPRPPPDVVREPAPELGDSVAP
jgi:hypothetical protein